jgi:protein-disulfide isomerase
VKIHHLLLGAALAVAACKSPSDAGAKPEAKAEDKTPVAKVGGETITAADLDKLVGAQLREMEQQHQEQIYNTKRQALEGELQKRIFEAKAKKENVSVEEYLKKVQTDLLAKAPEPTEDELKQVYEQAKAGGQQLPPFDQVKGDITRFIKQQKAQGHAMAFYEDLKKEMGAEVLLAPYLPAKVAVEAKGPSKGPEGAPITIVEFSDYQCPYCVRAEKTVAEVMAAYPDKVRLVYRDYPLDFHKQAPKASEAAYCAQDQGKYWEMHARLFKAEGKDLEIEKLKTYARELGLDGGKFDTCLDSGEKAKVIEEHKKAGEAVGVNGTPAFFVNGRPLPAGAQPLDVFKKFIDQELKDLAAVAKK